jgi:hypothetical protein
MIKKKLHLLGCEACSLVEFTCVSEEHTASVSSSSSSSGSLLDLLFDLEDGGSILLRNAGRLSPDYVMSPFQGTVLFTLHWTTKQTD